MKIELESTTRTVELELDGVVMPARVWEGRTSSGIDVHAFITRVAVHRDADQSEFEAELATCRDPLNGDLAAYPLRIVL